MHQFKDTVERFRMHVRGIPLQLQVRFARNVLQKRVYSSEIR
jgi:hypothetical protein